MTLTLRTALMLISGQITAELRDTINSKDRSIREDVKKQHMLSEYFSTVNKVDTLLESHKDASVEVKEVTFGVCCQAVIAQLNKRFYEYLETSHNCNDANNLKEVAYWIRQCSIVNELESQIYEISKYFTEVK